MRRGNSAEGMASTTPSKKQIDVIEVGNKHAQCLCAIFEIGLADNIGSLRRASTEANPQRTLFDYVDGNGPSDRDVEAREELWADFIANHATKKTLPVFREALLLLDSGVNYELTKADNVCWRYAWAKGHAQKMTNVWQFVRRRCIPKMNADGTIKEVGSSCDAVNRLRKWWKEHFEANASELGSQEQLACASDESQSPSKGGGIASDESQSQSKGGETQEAASPLSPLAPGEASPSASPSKGVWSRLHGGPGADSAETQPFDTQDLLDAGILSQVEPWMRGKPQPQSTAKSLQSGMRLRRGRVRP